MLSFSKESAKLISKILAWIRCRKKLCAERIRIEILWIKGTTGIGVRSCYQTLLHQNCT